MLGEVDEAGAGVVPVSASLGVHLFFEAFPFGGFTPSAINDPRDGDFDVTGYDADWFREALKDKGIRACIPGRKQRKKAVKCGKRRYKRRNRIEIMFGRLKD